MFLRRRNLGRVSSSATGRSSAKRLRLESLEDRRMLALDFVFNVAPGTPDDFAFGFAQAAEIWKGLLNDDVTVVVDISGANLGGNTIGDTTNVENEYPYADVLAALQADSTTSFDASAVATLSNGPLDVLINRTIDNPLGSLNPAPYVDADGGLNNTTISLSRANAKAIGLLPAQDRLTSDGAIRFNTAFPFDYDRTDGITPGTQDFLYVATHEIGHLLGFVSGVDFLDFFSASQQQFTDDSLTFITALDLFRSSDLSRELGADLDFTVDGRAKDFSIDDGQSYLGAFSEGSFLPNDGQASHWKDDDFTGVFLGFMDPTTAGPGPLPGGPFVYGLDVIAFDVIGWDPVQEPGFIRAVASGGSTIVSEDGTVTDTISVTLNKAPVFPVVVRVTPSDATEVSVAPTPLTFTAQNWNIPQIVTVSGVIDSLDDGDQTSRIVFDVNPTLSDDAFDRAPRVSIPVTTTGNGLLRIDLSGNTTVIREGDTRKIDAFSITLAKQPVGNVIVRVVSNDPTEARIAISDYTFTTSNWNLPKQVLITPVDDTVRDGDQVATITVSIVSVANPVDANFLTAPQSQIAVKVLDNETSKGLGDFDGNRVVNAADQALLRASFGSKTNRTADANGDGQVNAADYTVWRDNLGYGQPPVAPRQGWVYETFALPGGSAVAAATASADNSSDSNAFAGLTLAPVQEVSGSRASLSQPAEASASDDSLLLLLAETHAAGDAGDEAFLDLSSGDSDGDGSAEEASLSNDAVDAALLLL